MTVPNFRIDAACAREPLETARSWLAHYDTIALATVVSTLGPPTGTAAKGPAEIAVSILAEIVDVFRGRR